MSGRFVKIDFWLTRMLDLLKDYCSFILHSKKYWTYHHDDEHYAIVLISDSGLTELGF